MCIILYDENDLKIGKNHEKIICRSIFVLLAVGGFAAIAICIQLGVTQGFDDWVYGWVSQTITLL